MPSGWVGDQPQLQRGDPPQEPRPDQIAPQTPQQQEIEEQQAHDLGPPAGKGQTRSAVGDLYRPVRVFRAKQTGEPADVQRNRQDEADDLGGAGIPELQRLGDDARGLFEGARGEDRRADELAELAAQAAFDLLFGEDEQADRDEEPRPGPEVEQVGVAVGRAESAPRDEAEDERNAPGERDIDLGPPSRQQCVLLQKAEAPLQLEKGAAVRGEIFADAARFLVREFRHFRSPPGSGCPGPRLSLTRFSRPSIGRAGFGRIAKGDFGCRLSQD